MSEKIDRYSEYRQAGAALGALRKQATRLAFKSYTEKDAENAAGMYADFAEEVLEQAPILREAILTAEGGDVLVPAIRPDMQDNVLTFSVGDQGYRSASPLIPAEGNLAGIMVERTNDENEERVELGALLMLAMPQPSLDVPFGGKPFTSFRRIDYARVPLSNRADASVNVKQLEILQNRKEAFIDLCKSGLGRSIYAKKLRTLDRALASETHELIQLKDISLVRSIGRLGKDHADALNTKNDRVTAPLLRVLGSGRQLYIDAEEILCFDDDGDLIANSGPIIGRVIDICAELRGTKTDALLAALEEPDGSTIGYVPLDKVNELWF